MLKSPALAALSPERARLAPGNASEVLATRVGELRTVRLVDGSRVTLGGNTRLRAVLETNGRHIELSRGEAYFAVAKDRTRPFTVRAGETTVTAVGTEFNVRRREDQVDVTMVEGKVFVQPQQVSVRPQAVQHHFAPSIPVSAGEKAVVGETDVSLAHVDDASASAAWRSGRLVFDREPLKDVIQDVNRYSGKPIEVLDAEIGALMFTGTVLDGNVEGWLSSIESIFDLQAVDEGNRVVLRRRAR